MNISHKSNIDRIAELHEKYPERIENFYKIAKLCIYVGLFLVAMSALGTYFLHDVQTAMIIFTVLTMAGFSSFIFGIKEVLLIQKAINNNKNKV